MSEHDPELRLLAEDLKSRQHYRRGPTRIRESITQLLFRTGYGQLESGAARQQAWQQASGKLAEHSVAGRLNRGVLTVYVRNSMILQELTFQQQQLIRRLQQVAPDQNIRSLRFRVGPID